MLHHLRAVRRATRRALLIADLPYGAYHVSEEKALEVAIRYLKEGGAEAVKIEGGRMRAPLIRRMVEAEIPVMAHIGLTPQSVHAMGGYRVQGKTLESANELLADAEAIEEAGAFAIVLEGVPRELAAIVTRRLRISTIGIGAGPDCDGQILVFHDLVGLSFLPRAKFVRPYADTASTWRKALAHFREDILDGGYPDESESYHWSATLREEFERSATPRAG
jgi:3-methyl-2-oxobutanoate hydroxymethyltransferase